MTRNVRALRTEGVVAYQPMYDAATGDLRIEAIGSRSMAACATTANTRRAKCGFALALLEARGELDPDSAEAEQLVADFLKDVDDARGRPHARAAPQLPRVHGRHPAADLGQGVRARTTALTGSVMEYTPVNIALKGEKQGAYFTADARGLRLLGDRVRVQADRAPIRRSRGTRAHRRAGRRAANLRSRPTRTSASRSTRWSTRTIWAATRWRFYRRRVKLSQELWQRLEQRQLPAGEQLFGAAPAFPDRLHPAGPGDGTRGQVRRRRRTRQRLSPAAPRLPITPVDAEQAARSTDDHRPRDCSAATASRSRRSSCASWPRTGSSVRRFISATRRRCRRWSSWRFPTACLPSSATC